MNTSRGAVSTASESVDADDDDDDDEDMVAVDYLSEGAVMGVKIPLLPR
jgi:hypothetical protein